jgi:DNA-directed RNA polymerase subunit M/transcription elongation factor TFIIS
MSVSTMDLVPVTVPTDPHNPTTLCPKCGHEEEDFDGFGFVGQCSSCGYCNHPNSTLENGKWICGICGKDTKAEPHSGGLLGAPLLGLSDIDEVKG